ncbi:MULTISPECIES: aminoacyl-tRNA deacylase [Cupriavidus]|uniref:YbaK/prolyl-tRNA synthetase associated region n=1 Tax=Cupriavidus pinatubonensis (strain JMP 134 / LMG 1197) TaxID=264198 RepID=Q46WD6_CUPPJ|nr:MULTISPECIES: YbaK/EbsC family protein [Cupriavidus]QYY31383.1 YbaK/EbsC family protein [Cupriavidus pinatubonensis]TPQ37412.1 deacylase [Cupriavidus pinatubonensis]
MTMATTLASCLDKKQTQFDTVRHPYSLSSMATAHAAHIPGDRLAKTVLLEDEKGYLAAVIPSTHHLKLSEICEQTGRKLSLAHEDGVREVFRDCDVGALPPVGMAYGMQTWLDDSLLTHSDVYFEAGDHQELVHMSTEQFMALMSDAQHGHFAHRMM